MQRMLQVSCYILQLQLHNEPKQKPPACFKALAQGLSGR